MPASPPRETVAPSAVPLFDGAKPPHALDADEIVTIVDAWGDAASRAHEAGFEVVEVHAAHGYLLHQFLSCCLEQAGRRLRRHP